MKVQGFLCALGATFATSLSAQTLVLPPSNELTVGLYGDVSVYSLDLLQKCFDAGDARCTPSGPYPVQSSPGQIDDKIIIYKNSNGAPLSNYNSGPFAAGTQAAVGVDDPFSAPTGITPSFDMSTTNEPTGENGAPGGAADFAGDVLGRWDAKLSSVLSYLNGSDLVFLFDNNQQGSDLNQAQAYWAQIRLTDAAGNDAGKCWELNSQLNVPGGTGCGAGNPTYTDAANPGDFVSTIGRFCVSVVDGAVYSPGAANAAACNANVGDYFVNNNLGQNNAEFAAYVGELNDNLAAWAALGYHMSINFKLRGLNDGGEQLWICSDCSLVKRVPEPGSLALVSLALIGLGGASLRRRRNRG